MRKTRIASAFALIIMTNYEANAMTLVSLRPNIIHTAVTAQTEPTIHPSAFDWLITIAETTIVEMNERPSHIVPAGHATAHQTYDI